MDDPALLFHRRTLDRRGSPLEISRSIMEQDLAIDAARFAKLQARLLATALARHYANRIR